MAHRQQSVPRFALSDYRVHRGMTGWPYGGRSIAPPVPSTADQQVLRAFVAVRGGASASARLHRTISHVRLSPGIPDAPIRAILAVSLATIRQTLPTIGQLADRPVHSGLGFGTDGVKEGISDRGS